MTLLSIMTKSERMDDVVIRQVIFVIYILFVYTIATHFIIY
jgi:hypothetical protein